MVSDFQSISISSTISTTKSGFRLLFIIYSKEVVDLCPNFYYIATLYNIVVVWIRGEWFETDRTKDNAKLLEEWLFPLTSASTKHKKQVIVNSTKLSIPQNIYGYIYKY